MEWWTLSLYLFGGMLLVLFLGVNIPFGLGLISLIGILVMWRDPAAGMITIANEAYSRGTSYLMVSIPMFVLLAEVIMAGGISKQAYDSLSRFLCRVPGALAVATTVLATMFAALTGSSLANAAVIGRVSIQEMTRYSYARSLAGGVIAAGGTLGILIPPSIPLIFYALFTGESVGKLFIAGVVPGLLSAFLMVLYIVVRVKLDPKLAPPLPRVGFIDSVKSGYKIFPMVFLILFMFYAFYAGVATPTEIGAVAAFVAFLMVIIYKELDWPKLKAAWLSTVRTTVMLMWILIAALAFGTVLAYGRVPQNLTSLITDLSLSPLLLMLAINVFLLLVGCVLETGAIMMVIWPLLIAVAEGAGFDLVWFAIILVIQMELGQITPPVGMVLFGMKAIAPEISVSELYRGVFPFVMIQIATVVLIVLFPGIVLWLPNLMS